MVDIKPFKLQILKEMARLMKPDGFKSKLAEQNFSLAKPFGRWIVHLSFIPHRGVDLHMTVGVAIRVDAVERLVNDGRPELRESDSAKTATVGCELGNLIGTGQKRWEIASSTEVGAVASSIYSEVKSIGWPFLERYSNMESLLDLLTSLNPRNWLMSHASAARCQRAMALAYLLGGTECVRATERRCEEVLSGKDGKVLQVFLAFVESLQAKMESGNLPILGVGVRSR